MKPKRSMSYMRKTFDSFKEAIKKKQNQQHADHQNLRLEENILSNRIRRRIRDREAREEVKEVGKRGKGGGGSEGGEREKCSSCTLSFKGAKNFIPGKALFSFLSLENSVSTLLFAAAVHTLVHAKTGAVFCANFFCPLSRPHTHPCVVLNGPVQTANAAFPGAGSPDQVSNTGVAGVIAIEEVASPGMHGSRHDQTCNI